MADHKPHDAPKHEPAKHPAHTPPAKTTEQAMPKPATKGTEPEPPDVGNDPLTAPTAQTTAPMGEPGKPVYGLKEVVAPPAAPPPPAAPMAPARRKCQVSFKDNKTMILEATDRADAWDQYRALCGIISTMHEPQITWLDEQGT